MSIKLSWTPNPTTDNTRIYRGRSLDKLELKAELATRDRDDVSQAGDMSKIPVGRVEVASWLDTDKLPLGDHFYAVVLGEGGVYSEPAVIKVTLQPKVLPATGLKIEIVPDVAPAAPAIEEPTPAEASVAAEA